MSTLLIHDVPIECINHAAVAYYVPASVIISVLEIEGGRVGLASKNKNGTFDYGPMQINSIWLDELKKYGYSARQLQYDPCANVEVGTWILARAIAEGRSLWQGVGNYHSHTDSKNTRYWHKVNNAYVALSNYLNDPQSHGLYR